MKGEKYINEAIPAFIVMFLILISTASALEYDQCATSAQVGDGWWDGTECEGGIYGFGTVYFKWADVPFTNETHEVTDVKLVISGLSPGTPFYMYVWNGYGWSRMSGGVIDFRGDYVYDLYHIPGPYADGSMRIKIMNTGPETLYIDGISAVIQHESIIKELTVEVRDCETKKLLEGAEVETDGIEKETDAYGIAVFNLPKYKSFAVTVGGEDFYEVQTAVYMGDDEELEVCVYHEDLHAVDVRELDIDYGYIKFEIENTGNVESDIKYMVFVDDKQIYSGTINLDPEEEDDLAAFYDFSPGRYRVKAKADSHGYLDSVSEIHCVEGFTDRYTCSDGKLMREKITSSCGITWKIVEYCDSCDSGNCAGYDDREDDEEDGSCDADITSFNYLGVISEDAYQTVDIGVRNMGTVKMSAVVKVYVDGSYVTKKSVTIPEGDTAKTQLRFRMTEGVHSIKAEVTACGSVKDSVYSGDDAVKVTNGGVEPGVPEPNPIPDAPEPEEVKRIFIETYTGTEDGVLYSEECEGVALRVTPYPPTEEYMVSVTGVSKDWLDYPKTVNSLEQRDFYVYVAPQESGNYTLKVRVWLKDDIKVYDQEDVELVATPKEGTGAAGTGGDGITGEATAAGIPLWGLMIAIALVATVMVLMFLRHSMIEVHGHEPIPADYDSGLRQAALDGWDSDYYGGSGDYVK